jgi:hypothetical protein
VTRFRGGSLLARILERTRPPGPEMTPAEWGRWAARRYSTAIGLASPPAEIRWAPPVSCDGTLTTPLSDGWARRAAFIRKRLALALFVIADERVGDAGEASPWFAQASRWAATYDRLPGGDVPETPGLYAEIDELRAYERAAIRLRDL